MAAAAAAAAAAAVVAAYNPGVEWVEADGQKTASTKG